MISDTIAITEIIWSIAALPGVIVWALFLKYTMSVVRAFQSDGRRANQVISHAMLLLAYGGLTAEIVFLLWGLIGMTQENVTREITLMGWVFTAGIVLIASVTLAVGIILRRTIAVVWDLANGKDSKA